MRRVVKPKIAAQGPERRARIRSKIVWKAEEWADRYALSPAEREIFSLLAQGTTRRRVMRDKRIREHTLKRHAMHIIAKTGDKSVFDAILRMLHELL